ncbi:MAG: hypothetical protein ABIQ93_00710 [Saprospiraceae bacterium]
MKTRTPVAFIHLLGWMLLLGLLYTFIRAFQFEALDNLCQALESQWLNFAQRPAGGMMPPH